MRTIILSKKAESYLKKCANEQKVAIGIMIGQKSLDEKCYIIHLAKLSDDEEFPSNDGQDSSSIFENMNIQHLAEQWISASKMTPGSFDVQGIFITGEGSDLNVGQNAKDMKKLLNKLNCLVTHNKFTCQYVEDNNELETLVLCYNATASSETCKVFSNSNGENLNQLDYKFVDKLPQWYLFESNYELDDVFPITENQEQVNIENQFNAALQSIKLNIDNSEIFIQQQNVEDNITIENYIKEQGKKNDISIFTASILLTANISNEFLIKVRQFNGTIRFSGVVSSRVWCQSKNTFTEIKNHIKRDILRSMAARIQVYCDGLTDLHSNNAGVVMSEPPRRIYFTYPESQGIQFSEYIFRGETPSVAVAQAKQILDMDINSDSIFDDLEGLPDDEIVSLAEDFTVNSQKSLHFEISRSMYMLGVAVALLVLLLSVLLHYLLTGYNGQNK